MFGDLPKIFDRNFVLNFFFPALIFVVLENYFLPVLGIARQSLPYLKGDLVNDLTVIALFSYLVGVILLIINRLLHRFLAGYGRLNPFRLVGGFQKTRYERIIQELKVLDDEYRKSFDQQEEFPHRSRIKRNETMRYLSERFPDKEEFLLPTPFGNILRSFEIYPRVMYGIEYVDSWSRLQAVMPIDYRGLVDDSKAQLDLWINFQCLSAIVVTQIGWALSITYTFLHFLLLIFFFAFSLFCMSQANHYALVWGDYVKSSFDMFLPKMREVLGLPPVETRDAERRQWTGFSQAIIYRYPHLIPAPKSPDIQLKVNDPTKSVRSKTAKKKKD